MKANMKIQHNGFVYRCQAVVQGILFNPVLPKLFDDTENYLRPVSHRKFLYLPYIQGPKMTSDEGNFYVHCLDEGCHDRPTMWGCFSTLQAAIECVQNRLR